MGARLVLVTILLGQVVAEVALALAHDMRPPCRPCFSTGRRGHPCSGAISTMLNGLTSQPSLQQRAFAVNFALQNMALGIGAVVAAVVVSAHHPGTFQVLFLANGFSCLVFAGRIVRVAEPAANAGGQSNPDRYRYVLGHRGLRLMILASLLLAFTGPATFDSGVPGFASVAAHISDHAIAVSFTVDTAVIVAIQMLVCGSSAGTGEAPPWLLSALSGWCPGRCSDSPKSSMAPVGA